MSRWHDLLSLLFVGLEILARQERSSPAIAVDSELRRRHASTRSEPSCKVLLLTGIDDAYR
jgi:hypothetical protein